MPDQTTSREQIVDALYEPPASEDGPVAGIAHRVALDRARRRADAVMGIVDARIAAVEAQARTDIQTLEQRLAAVRAELDSWQATLDARAMAGTEWERCLATNLPTLRDAIGDSR